MTDDATPPKRRPGRPRRTPEQAAAAKASAVARATAHTRERRQRLVERTIAMTPETVAKADALIAADGLDGYTALVEILVDEETERRSPSSGKPVAGSKPAT